jgi:uncharacterized membrane protein YjfL (UPF0719 family)
MIAAPVSLAFGWINWVRFDRLSDIRTLRERTLFVGVVLLTIGGALYVSLIPLESWTRIWVSQSQKSILNAIAISGASCCIVAALAATIARGRSRVSVFLGGFFGLFMFAATTPLAYLP